MNAAVTQPTQGAGASNTLLTVVAIAGVGFGAWKLIDYLKERESSKETEKARANILKSEISLKKTKERIAEIERKAYRGGINGYGKPVTVNVINQAKEVINGFFDTYKSSAGLDTYVMKKPEKIKEVTIVDSIFKTPLNSLGTLAKVYNIYTGRDLLNDSQKLSANNYTKIKTLYAFAYKKYGK